PSPTRRNRPSGPNRTRHGSLATRPTTTTSTMSSITPAVSATPRSLPPPVTRCNDLTCCCATSTCRSAGGPGQRPRCFPAGASPRARALLLNSVAPHSVIAVPVAERLETAREAVAAWEALGDVPQLYVALGLLASQYARSGDHDAAAAALERARSLEDPGWP